MDLGGLERDAFEPPRNEPRSALLLFRAVLPQFVANDGTVNMAEANVPLTPIALQRWAL